VPSKAALTAHRSISGPINFDTTLVLTRKVSGGYTSFIRTVDSTGKGNHKETPSRDMGVKYRPVIDELTKACRDRSLQRLRTALLNSTWVYLSAMEKWYMDNNKPDRANRAFLPTQPVPPAAPSPPFSVSHKPIS
jgi:hypothetical protein